MSDETKHGNDWNAVAQDLAAENDRLRALNAEMRNMLIILRKECGDYELAVSGETFLDTELNALIAKSEATT